MYACLYVCMFLNGDKTDIAIYKRDKELSGDETDIATYKRDKEFLVF